MFQLEIAMKERMIPHNVRMTEGDREALEALASASPLHPDPSKLLRDAIHTCVTNPSKLTELFAKLLMDDTAHG